MKNRLLVHGKQKLNGKVNISGAKNAALPLSAAAILSDDGLTLKNVPPLSDINTMSTLLTDLGCTVSESDQKLDSCTMFIDSRTVSNFTAKYELVKQMRASILVLGPMLAKFGKCTVSMPGGCSIGIRPIDLHLRGMETLGATISLENGYIKAEAPNGLHGGKFVFPIVTVTGTENVLMAAVLAKGTSILINAASEPEIVDLANCLNKMGAKITGHGTPTIIVEGVSSLHHTTHKVISDRIEAGTYAIAAGITGGQVELVGDNLGEMLSTVIGSLSATGMEISSTNKSLIVKGPDRILPVNVETKAYPGFPTDLQAQMMAYLCKADGTSIITESIWENRFMHVPELVRMGANITVCGSTAVVKKTNRLKGAQVMATDLRASFSLVIAALAAEGDSIIDRLYHLDRGYACVEEKFAGCGVEVERIE